MRTLLVSLLALCAVACSGGMYPDNDGNAATDAAPEASPDAPACVRDDDCSQSPDKHRCWEGACILECSEPGYTCPAGLACVDLGDSFHTPICR